MIASLLPWLCCRRRRRDFVSLIRLTSGHSSGSGQDHRLSNHRSLSPTASSEMSKCAGLQMSKSAEVTSDTVKCTLPRDTSARAAVSAAVHRHIVHESSIALSFRPPSHPTTHAFVMIPACRGTARGPSDSHWGNSQTISETNVVNFWTDKSGA